MLCVGNKHVRVCARVRVFFSSNFFLKLCFRWRLFSLAAVVRDMLQRLSPLSLRFALGNLGQTLSRRMVVTVAQIEEKLKDKLSTKQVEVIDTSGGCGASFAVKLLVSEQFEGKRLLGRHRLVSQSQTGGWEKRLNQNCY